MDWRQLSSDRRQDWLDQGETQLFLRELARREETETQQVLARVRAGKDAQHAGGKADAFREALELAGRKEGKNDQGADDSEEEDDRE